MKLKTFAVLDTNVLVSATLSKTGFPRDIFTLTENGNIIPIFDERILREYNDVLHYEKFSFDEESIYDTLYPVISNGMLINDVEQAKAKFSDRTDIPFFEVKESSEELDSYLVTGNKKHFPESSSTVTPKELLNIMERLDKWVAVDFNYEKNIEEIKQMQTSTSKYTSGKELIDEMFNAEDKTINLSSRLIKLQFDAQQMRNRMYVESQQTDDFTKN